MFKQYSAPWNNLEQRLDWAKRCKIQYQYPYSKKNKMSRARSPYDTYGKCIQNFISKSEGRWPFGRPRCTWWDNIKTDLKEI